MRIELDAQRCCGHAMCNAVAPEVYDLDEYGHCAPVASDVLPELADAAAAGAEACPERALRVVEHHPG